jgi:hypothetical protein
LNNSNATARSTPAVVDRLVPFGEACGIVGVRSRTSLYKLIADGELAPISSGRNQFFLASELAEYVGKLAATRQGARA